jgi:hypothetical protein
MHPDQHPVAKPMLPGIYYISKKHRHFEKKGVILIKQ